MPRKPLPPATRTGPRIISGSAAKVTRKAWNLAHRTTRTPVPKDPVTSPVDDIETTKTAK